MFYLGKHREKKFQKSLISVQKALVWCWGEVFWYARWWINLPLKAYRFITLKGNQAIEKYDDSYDRMFERIKRCILLYYITIMINLQSFIIMNQIEIGKLTWIGFLCTPQKKVCII